MITQSTVQTYAKLIELYRGEWEDDLAQFIREVGPIVQAAEVKRLQSDEDKYNPLSPDAYVLVSAALMDEAQAAAFVKSAAAPGDWAIMFEYGPRVNRRSTGPGAALVPLLTYTALRNFIRDYGLIAGVQRVEELTEEDTLRHVVLSTQAMDRADLIRFLSKTKPDTIWRVPFVVTVPER